MDDLDRRIINSMQGDFPVCEYPFQAVARQLGIEQSVLLDRLQQLLDEGVLSRFGPMYHAERMGGGLTLAALKVPGDRFERVTDIVNSFPEVAHNYARDHVLNMWFVLATEKPEQVEEVLSRIEIKTGLKVYNMPKINEYYVGLRLEA